MTMSGLTAEATFAPSGSRGREKKKTLVWEKKVCVHVQHCAREKIETERESKKTLIQRASVCSPTLSITLDSQGPFRTAVNHSPALPARRLEAQDKPTAELHPVCPPAPPVPHIARPQWATAAHFTLQEDPVCQSSSNRPVCEWDGSLRPTWVVAGGAGTRTGRRTNRQRHS